ncbi:MAG TPA: hypothetical protein VN581_04620 [Patescibacteria group bacterium]|nr:hypothetical protein [Patescibacteria group bacterium]
MNRSLSALFLPLCAVIAAFAPAVAAPLRFEQVEIAGAPMQLPKGWTRQQDDYGLILSESNDDDSPVLALIGVQGQPGQYMAPRQVADTVLAQLDLPTQGIVATLIEERDQNGALYRLHQLQEWHKPGYLASYTYTDVRSGAIVHLFFSALEQRFIELGGPMLPLIAFAGMPAAALDQLQRDVQARAAMPVSGNGDGNAAARAADEAAAYALASRISAISHETHMKILYNMDSGWCYRGESDCE